MWIVAVRGRENTFIRKFIYTTNHIDTIILSTMTDGGWIHESKHTPLRSGPYILCNHAALSLRSHVTPRLSPMAQHWTCDRTLSSLLCWGTVSPNIHVVVLSCSSRHRCCGDQRTQNLYTAGRTCLGIYPRLFNSSPCLHRR